MLTRFTEPSASALRRALWEPRVSRPVVPVEALGSVILKAFLFVGAAALAISIVIFMRVVLTAHQVPRWQEELAKFLPFLD